MRIGGREFEKEGKTYIMGILNVTPDSFSDGGRFIGKDRALFRVEEMLAEGMDVLDVGGESTRPGYTEVSAREEEERVIPVIEAVKSRFDVPVSLDTSKPEVARAGVLAGIDMINDVKGSLHDARMVQVIAKSGLPCCLVHSPEKMGGGEIMRTLSDDLAGVLRAAGEAGIARERILLDPGIGFGKTDRQNLQILQSLEKLHELGCPLLLGASRKSVIGSILDLPVEERLEGTLATTVMAVIKGCMFVRVHDVRENVRAVRMTEAILHA